MTDVNIWIVLAGGISAVVIGFVWYAPIVFGKMWMELADIKPGSLEAGTAQRFTMALAGLVTATVLSWVLAQFALLWQSFTLGSALELGFWVWLGFMMPVIVGPMLWEQKSPKFVAINAGYWLVATLCIAVIVSLWA